MIRLEGIEISYTDKNGVLQTLTELSPDFVKVSNRLSDSLAIISQNQTNRNNYEQAIRNAQIDADAGRPVPSLPVPPICQYAPEDFTLPIGSIDWNPPLLTLTLPVTHPPDPILPSEPPTTVTVPIPVSGNVEDTIAAIMPELIGLFTAFLKAHLPKTL